MGPRSLSSSTGFTLVEVLVAMTVMFTGTVFALALLDRSNEFTRGTAAREAATSLARELTESVRGVSYDELDSATLLSRLAAQPGLEDSVPGGQYTLLRRDRVFTVTGEVCMVDDPRDGRGDQSAGGYCAGSASGTGGPLDKNPQDYKRASVTVSWAVGSETRILTQSVVINNPGSAEAPFVRSIAPGSGYSNTIAAVVSSIPLQFTTDKPAASVNWTVDGTVRAPAATPNAARDVWTTTWDIASLPDGTYPIGAEAFNADGMSGSALQTNILLNRFPPTAPTDFAGGRTKPELPLTVSPSPVELEWAANTERDIIGYEVQRFDGKIVCTREATRLNTECRDLEPPPPLAASLRHSFTYTVFAYDRDPHTNAPRRGPGTTTSVIDYNVTPPAPAQFQAGTGGVTLQWNRAEDSKPNGDAVAFYRIYRDGKSYDHRYVRWYDNATNAVVTWTEPKPDGATHEYWVTTVDLFYGESELTTNSVKATP